MTPTPVNPLDRFIRHQGAIVLDGGLATELERRGVVLDDALWSARVLVDDPEQIRQVHIDYLRAGADCITSASYQASVPGFARSGIGRADARRILAESVRIAREARDRFWREAAAGTARLEPIVAASVGPYGAYLADGSEYTGDYAIGKAGLRDFHEERWDVLAAAGPDILACETVPSGDEVDVLVSILCERPDVWAWLSVTCRDGLRLRDGTAVETIAASCDPVPNLAAIGVNCTAPGFVTSVVAAMRARTTKPILVYPNSGEDYDAQTGRWSGERAADWRWLVDEWLGLGVIGVGGCCRVRPVDIAKVGQQVRSGPGG